MNTRLIHWKKFIFLGIYALGFTGSIWVRLPLLCKRTQNLTITDLEKHQVMCTWNPVNTRLCKQYYWSTSSVWSFCWGADFSSAKRPKRRGVRRDSCTPWRDKLSKMINIYMRCVAIKNRRLLNWPASWNLLKRRFMQIFFGTPLYVFYSKLFLTWHF